MIPREAKTIPINGCGVNLKQFTKWKLPSKADSTLQYFWLWWRSSVIVFIIVFVKIMFDKWNWMSCWYVRNYQFTRMSRILFLIKNRSRFRWNGTDAEYDCDDWVGNKYVYRRETWIRTSQWNCDRNIRYRWLSIKIKYLITHESLEGLDGAKKKLFDWCLQLK